MSSDTNVIAAKSDKDVAVLVCKVMDMITFDELHCLLSIDPFYGLESQKIQPFIEDIYKTNARNVRLQQFRYDFSHQFFKNQHQRHLIYLWCGVMGLPAYERGQLCSWKPKDYLKNYAKNFDIKQEELKAFLRQHSWPLPAFLFPDAPDSSKLKIELSDEEFTRTVRDLTVTLPRLEAELEELRGIPPASMTEATPPTAPTLLSTGISNPRLRERH